MGSDKDTLTTGHLVSDDAIFKATKEIVVKFIEVGRLTPANFDETFTRVFQTIRKTVRSK